MDIENPKSEIRKRAKFWFLIAVLLAGGIIINWVNAGGEASVVRRPLSEIPRVIGEWDQRGAPIRFDQATESVLGTTDYTMREFTLVNGRVANVYIGYYSSRRTGATYHSPQNCLPGAGWVMKEPEIIQITTERGKSFPANRFIIENGIYKEVLIYWYQGRGRALASEYNDKIYTIWDSVVRHRSDGAMVRVMTSVGDSESEATNAATGLAAQIAERLSEYVPD